jgi:ribosomal protein S18 acetylase RimI-like enzyme
MRIRALAIDDYDQMIQLWRRAGLPFRCCGRDSRRSIETQMQANPSFFLGAFEGSHLIGTVIASCDGRKGWINRLAVDPDYQRQGIAKDLVAEAEKVLQKEGIQVFSTLVFDSNEASKNLFKKCGYRELKEIKYFSKRESQEV